MKQLIGVISLFVLLFVPVARGETPGLEQQRQLREAFRMHDGAQLQALQNTILQQYDKYSAQFLDEMIVAESYLLRADESRYERYRLELSAKELKRYRNRQADWGADGLRHARKALKLARTDQDKTNALRVISELYAHQITGTFSAASKGPDAKYNLEEALKISPDDPECNRVLGIMYLYNPVSCDGDVKKAIAAFRKSIAGRPDEDIYYYYLALALQADHDLPQAIEAARKALEVNPRNIYAGHLHEVLNRVHLDSATTSEPRP